MRVAKICETCGTTTCILYIANLKMQKSYAESFSVAVALYCVAVSLDILIDIFLHMFDVFHMDTSCCMESSFVHDYVLMMDRSCCI